MEDFHAIESAAKCAFVALDMGASALQAVQRAAARDPYTRGRSTTMACVCSI